MSEVWWKVKQLAVRVRTGQFVTDYVCKIALLLGNEKVNQSDIHKKCLW